MIDLEDLNNPDYDVLTKRILDADTSRVTDYENNTAERCYVTSNEYLDQYFEKLALQGKRIVTVGSSGDQVLNAIYYGAKDITLFDANPYARAFIEYKMAMIKNFNLHEFIYLVGDPQYFNFRTYKKISHDLSEPAKRFFDTLMLEQDDISIYNGDLAFVDYDAGFGDFHIDERLTQGQPLFASQFYQDEKNYQKLKDKLNANDFKLYFITGDIFQMPKIINGKFDAFFFSNIANYFIQDFEWLQYEELLEELYGNYLNDGGVIQFDYKYYDPEDEGDIYLNPNLPVSEWTSMPILKGKKVTKQRLASEGNENHSVYFVIKPSQDEAENEQ